MKNRLRERARRVGVKKKKKDISTPDRTSVAVPALISYIIMCVRTIYVFLSYYSNNIITGPAGVIVVPIRADDVSQFSPSRSLLLLCI